MALVVLVAVAICACSSPDETARVTVERIVEDLAAQRYATATTLYREAEDLVLSEAAVQSWRRALDHEDATVRQWAVDALSRIGDPSDFERVVAALDDTFRKVQQVASEGVIRMDSARARDVFMRRLEAAEPMARALAAQSLADMEETTAVLVIIQQLQNDALDDGIRDLMAQSLGRLADPRAAMPLADVALDESLALQLRRSAAEAVAMLSAADSEEALRRLRQADDEYIRDLAELALQN